MVLKLDPRFPMVWRNPFALQFGLDPVVARFDDVSTAEERMIAALSVGVNRQGLELIARGSGAAIGDVDTLLESLRPVLETRSEPTSGSVMVTGTGTTADRVIGNLAEAGIRVFIAPTVEDAERGRESTRVDLAIAIGHFVLHPDLHGLWLRRDISHLPVVFGDSSVTIGPLVDAGKTACLYCVTRYRTDADPAWPAISAQLLGRRSAIETPLVAAEVAALVCRLALGQLEGRAAGSVISLNAASGEVSVSESPLHPHCGCSTLAGTDWADEPHPGPAFPPLPRTATVSAAHA